MAILRAYNSVMHDSTKEKFGTCMQTLCRRTNVVGQKHKNVLLYGESINTQQQH